MSKRTEQVSSLLQEEISRWLREHVDLPSGVMVTVTRVDVPPDLKNARVWVSVLPEGKRGSALEALRHQRQHLQEWLFHELTIRQVPRVHFQPDDTEEKAADIEALLNEVAAQDADLRKS